MTERISLYCSNPEQYENLRDELKALALESSRRPADQGGALLTDVLRSLIGESSLNVGSVMSLNSDLRQVISGALGSCLASPLSGPEKTNLARWLESANQPPKAA